MLRDRISKNSGRKALVDLVDFIVDDSGVRIVDGKSRNDDRKQQ